MRMNKFQAFMNFSGLAVNRDATSLAFEQFLASRESNFSLKIQTVQPSDIILFLCLFDTQGGCSCDALRHSGEDFGNQLLHGT